MRRAARVLYSFHTRAALPELLSPPGVTYLALNASLDESAAVQQRFSTITGERYPLRAGTCEWPVRDSVTQEMMPLLSFIQLCAVRYQRGVTKLLM